MKDPEDEAFEELSLKQGQWEHTSGWRKKQILETSMTQDEIFNMAVKCYLISTGNREGFYGDALIQFAKLVAEAEREACAKVCESLWRIDGQHSADEFAAEIRARGQT
jgi:hypothetical protein